MVACYIGSLNLATHSTRAKEIEKSNKFPKALHKRQKKELHPAGVERGS